MVDGKLKDIKTKLSEKGFKSRISQSGDDVQIYITLNQRYRFEKFAELFDSIGEFMYKNFPQIDWKSSTNVERSDDGGFELSIELKKSEYSYSGGTYYKKTSTDYKPYTNALTLTKGPVFIQFSTIRSYIGEGFTKDEFTLLERAYLDKIVKDIDPEKLGPSPEYKGGLSWSILKTATIYVDKYIGSKDGSEATRYLVMWSKDAEYKYYVLFDINEFIKIPLPEFQKARIVKSSSESTTSTAIPKVSKDEYERIRTNGEVFNLDGLEKDAIDNKLTDLIKNARSNYKIESVGSSNYSAIWYLVDGTNALRRIEIRKIRPINQNNPKFFISIKDLKSQSIDIYSFYYINSILRLPESLFK
jgi:hypothetical protein